MNSIAYNENGVQINLETTAPAATHELLMRGINDAIRYYVESPDKTKDTEGLIALLQLQNALIPKEQELNKIYD